MTPLTLREMFAHKIKSLDELLSAVGSRPREKKVIMCHGTFDVVHPGHLRHLVYAKSKAEVLIASVTADRHITKGDHRPHVPQDLRAANLAAFEFVDYVLIDENATPIETLKALQPDFFVKGYEYNAQGMHPKTAEELATIEAYGGEIIFSPGDIVYSSSRLINLAPPEIKLEKLMNLMEREGVSFADLKATLTGMKSKTVHVIGDTIVDSYTRCAMVGGQTKTPTLSVLFEEREDFVGGAGVVAKHLRCAGADVTFTTVLGDDELGKFVANDLESAQVKTNLIIDKTRPTTNKNAVIAGGYRLLKIDTLDNRAIAENILSSLVDRITTKSTDAVVFCDFRHGIFNRSTIPRLSAAIPKDAFKVADSQVASRWGNITEFQEFDLITPNEREARFALGDQDSGIRPLAHDLYLAARCKTLILKLGDRGILTSKHQRLDDIDTWFVVDSFSDHVVDPVGAGDALLAYATLAMLVSKSVAQASILGSLAAACECEQDGNIPVTPQAIEAKIRTIEDQISFRVS